MGAGVGCWSPSRGDRQRLQASRSVVGRWMDERWCSPAVEEFGVGECSWAAADSQCRLLVAPHHCLPATVCMEPLPAQLLPLPSHCPPRTRAVVGRKDEMHELLPRLCHREVCRRAGRGAGGGGSLSQPRGRNQHEMRCQQQLVQVGRQVGRWVGRPPPSLVTPQLAMHHHIDSAVEQRRNAVFVGVQRDDLQGGVGTALKAGEAPGPSWSACRLLPPP